MRLDSLLCRLHWKKLIFLLYVTDDLQKIDAVNMACVVLGVGGGCCLIIDGRDGCDGVCHNEKKKCQTNGNHDKRYQRCFKY